MTDESTLRKAFVDALDIAADTDWESLSYRGIEEWDSVAHMRLVAELEDVFDIMIETEDVIDMNSYVAARKLLGKYGVDFA
ncbi:acyl carrier protein [Actinomycetes bacterium KLBMP 9759]